LADRAEAVAQEKIQALSERIALLTAERDRERSQLLETLADLRKRCDSLTALLTDQRPPRRGLWARVFRRS
jgi:hypothetical protein